MNRGRRGFDAETAASVAGVCFSLSSAFVVMLIVEWLQAGQERSGGAFGVILMVLVPAGISLLILHGENNLDPASLWALPVWSAAGLAAVMFVLLVLASRPAVKQGPEHPVEISSLSSSEVSELTELRQETLATLVERERLSVRIAERARQVPLGGLHTLDAAAKGTKPVHEEKPTGTAMGSEERKVERWARKGLSGGSLAELDKRTLDGAQQ